jgi:integrase
MPRKLPPFVLRERSRHGRVVFYFRKGKGARIRLPDLSDPEFENAYQRARAWSGEAFPVHRLPGKSLSWLIDQYQRSAKYAELSKATRRQRDSIFANVVKEAGSFPFADLTGEDFKAARERRKDTPAQARNFLDAMRGLYRWAKEAGHVETDPTEGVRNPGKSRSRDGFKAWTDADVARFEARWPEGTPQRQWLYVLLYTGVRRGDAVRLHSDQVKDGWIELPTEKTGMTVYIPLRPELTGITGWFISGKFGRPLAKESFGNLFRDACRAAGLDKSAHGLRKLAATKAAEAGLSVAELEALFGWTGGTMASHYTRAASRKRLAQSGLEKMREKPRT